MEGKLLRAALAAVFIAGAGPAVGQALDIPSPTLPPGPVTASPQPSLQTPSLSPSLSAPSVSPIPVPFGPTAPPSAAPVPLLPSLMPPSITIPDGLPPNTYAELTALYRTVADLYAAGKYAQAIPVAEEYVAKTGELSGDTEGLVYANAISLLSRLYQAQGKFDEAEPQLLHSLRILEQKGGAEGDVATELDALAQLYESQGQFEKAEHYFLRALVITEKNAASDPRRYGRALNDLAWVYQDENRYAEAEPRASKALDVLAKAFGEKDADYGCTLDTLAKLYEGQNRKIEAELWYRKALEVLEASLGPENVSTATTRENLGGLLKSLGKLDEAERLLSQALATKERVFGPDHPLVAKTLNQIGDLYRLQGKAEQSENVFKRVLTLQNGAVIEIPVFFVTDRRREAGGKTAGFANVSSEVLTFGRATVLLPKPLATPAALPLAARTVPIATMRDPEAVPEEEASAPAAAVRAPAAPTGLTHLALRGTPTSSEGELMQSAALQLGIHRGEALVFVHGYNVTFENALFRAAQIAYDTKFSGPVFLFSWAGRELIGGYMAATDSTDTASDHLFDFLKSIVGATKVKKIHFVAHSMGNKVLLRALDKMAADPGLRPAIGEIIDAAPDVESDDFVHMVNAIKGNGGSFTLYASRGDWALWVSSWLRGAPRAGFIGDKALIIPGVETIDVTDAGTSYFALNHDVYASNSVLVEDMKRIFTDRLHPPDQRTGAFEPVVANDGTYWRYHRAETTAAATPPPNSPSTGRLDVPATEATAAEKPAAIPAEAAKKVAPDAPASETAKVTPAASPPEGPGPVTATPEAAQPPATAAVTPPPDATAAITPPRAKKVQRKKQAKRDFDLTKPLQ